MPAKVDWHPIRMLAQRVCERGEPLELTDEVRALLQCSAREVAISSEDAEEALRNPSTATALLQEVRRRITDGSRRLNRARHKAYQLRDAGDLEGARKLMEEVLIAEVVPFYREQAEILLREVARLAAVASGGQVDSELAEWTQLPVLARRVEQGKSLELNNELHGFLRRTALTVAISEAEVEIALSNMEGIAALLGKMLARIRDGEQRITQALYRMTALRDAGDLKGARQQMRDVLAVEIVPQYRQIAEENLAGLDEMPREP
jgi:DUSAM domain-containing protein